MKISCTVIIVAVWLLTGQAVAENGSKTDVGSTIEGDVSADPFTVVLLPDTQYYSKNDDGTYDCQTRAISYRSLWPNIKMVIHLGDMTDDGSVINEWWVPDKAHYILEGADIPYTVVPGNHDYNATEDNDDKATRYRYRATLCYNNWFGPWRFAKQKWYGGHYDCSDPKNHTGCSKNDSNYAFFEEGNLKFMVVNLEYAPRPEVLCWANARIRDHPTRRVIIVTHGYLGPGGGFTTFSQEDGNSWSAKTIWDELVRRHSSVFMVLCGHIAGATVHTNRDSYARTAVYEILADYQKEPDNGNGWLRVLTFKPAEGVVSVVTRSVFDSVTELRADKDGKDKCVYDRDPDPPLSYDMTSPTPYEYVAGDEGDEYVLGKQACGSDFSFAGTLRVKTGKEFKIPSGARIIFRDGARMVVDGTVKADGTDNPILFLSKGEPRIRVSSTLFITGGGMIRLP